MPRVRILEAEEETPITGEFAGAKINGRRLVKRLCHTAEKLAEQPEKPISAACGSWCGVKAAYDLLGNGKADCEGILYGHRQCTIGRMKAYQTILIVQDTTLLDFSTHLKAQALGRSMIRSALWALSLTPP